MAIKVGFIPNNTNRLIRVTAGTAAVNLFTMDLVSFAVTSGVDGFGIAFFTPADVANLSLIIKAISQAAAAIGFAYSPGPVANLIVQLAAMDGNTYAVTATLISGTNYQITVTPSALPGTFAVQKPHSVYGSMGFGGLGAGGGGLANSRTLTNTNGTLVLASGIVDPTLTTNPNYSMVSFSGTTGQGVQLPLLTGAPASYGFSYLLVNASSVPASIVPSGGNEINKTFTAGSPYLLQPGYSAWIQAGGSGGAWGLDIPFPSQGPGAGADSGSVNPTPATGESYIQVSALLAGVAGAGVVNFDNNEEILIEDIEVILLSGAANLDTVVIATPAGTVTTITFTTVAGLAAGTIYRLTAVTTIAALTAAKGGPISATGGFSAGGSCNVYVRGQRK
jgi:hypothetical protein